MGANLPVDFFADEKPPPSIRVVVILVVVMNVFEL